LKQLGDEVGGAEQLGVGAEVGVVGRVVQHRGGVIFHDELAERHRCPGDLLRQSLTGSRRACGDAYRAVHAETTVSPLDHVLGQIDSLDMDESAVLIKASLQEQAVPMWLPASELP
jgi:hypothetical protein